MTIPAKYQYLADKDSANHPLGRVALSFFGVKETPGPDDNATILAWAREVGGAGGSWYDDDAKAWCGLFAAVVAKRAGYDIPKGFDLLRAKKWASWGVKATVPTLWDVLIFDREGGGHIGFYVGEDKTAYHVYGGNQKDMVCIVPIAKDRLEAVRRAPGLMPGRIVKLTASGPLSKNEA